MKPNGRPVEHPGRQTLSVKADKVQSIKEAVLYGVDQNESPAAAVCVVFSVPPAVLRSRVLLHEVEQHERVDL